MSLVNMYMSIYDNLSCTHTYICYAQTVDVDNPWIVLLKAWIHTCVDNSRIGSSIRRLRRTKGTEHDGFGQSSDAGIRHTANYLSEQEVSAARDYSLQA